MDRRTFVQRTGTAGLSLLALSLGSQRAAADPDPPPSAAGPTPASTTDPDIYSFSFGGTEAFVIQDGVFQFPIQPTFAPEGKPAEVEELLKRNFLPADRLALSLNVLVVKAQSGVMLFDAGAGPTTGPNSGKLLRGLRRIGIGTSDVKVVYVTHAHFDHIGGLLEGSNAPVFPTARIIAAKTEVDFWTADAPDLSGMRTPPEARTQTATTAKKLLDGMKPNLLLKTPGKLTPEVELLLAPGHTPGHSAFLVTQGTEKLIVLGDAVHAYALQFPHPEWTMIYDVDPALAVKSRTRLFKEAASDRTMLMGFHLPFPGLGHVREAGSGYEWVPRPWVM